MSKGEMKGAAEGAERGVPLGPVILGGGEDEEGQKSEGQEESRKAGREDGSRGGWERGSVGSWEGESRGGGVGSWEGGRGGRGELGVGKRAERQAGRQAERQVEKGASSGEAGPSRAVGWSESGGVGGGAGGGKGEEKAKISGGVGFGVPARGFGVEAKEKKKSKVRICQGCQSDRFWKKGVCDRCGLDEAGRDALLGRGVGGYLISARSREGDFGTVYQALEGKSQKKVALHLIREPIRRLLRESRGIEERLQKWAELSHPSLATLRGFGEYEGGLFWAADWLPGVLLSEWMRQARFGAPWGVILDLFKQLMDVLQAIHIRGLTHGQVRPSQILVSPQGTRWRLHLFDVGCGPLLWDREVQEVLRPGEAARVGMYLAPEQMLADLYPVDSHADLYSCGVLLFQLLTGRSPFRGMRWDLLYRQHLYAQPPSLRLMQPEREFSLEMDTLLLRALAKPPQDRFPSARSFYRMLEGMAAPKDAKGAFSLKKEARREDLSFPMGSLPLFVEEAEEVEMIQPPSRSRSFARWLVVVCLFGAVAWIVWFALSQV